MMRTQTLWDENCQVDWTISMILCLILCDPPKCFLFLRGNQHNWLSIAKHCPIQSKEEKSFLRKRLPSSILHPSCWLDFWTYPIGSMYCIFTYIYLKNQPNVGKYTIHGSYGIWVSTDWLDDFGNFGCGCQLKLGEEPASQPFETMATKCRTLHADWQGRM